jgi:hypothetical protein
MKNGIYLLFVPYDTISIQPPMVAAVVVGEGVEPIQATVWIDASTPLDTLYSAYKMPRDDTCTLD